MSDDRVANIRKAVFTGLQAIDVLEALPEDDEYGYDKHEEMAQYAAVDRLIEAFKLMVSESALPPSQEKKTRLVARCNKCGEEVVFDAWIYADGSVHSQYDENLCLGCESGVGSRFTEAMEEA